MVTAGTAVALCSVMQTKQREEMLMAYGQFKAARGLQVDAVGQLFVTLDSLDDTEELRHIKQLANNADEAMRKLRLALARELGV